MRKVVEESKVIEEMKESEGKINKSLEMLVKDTQDTQNIQGIQGVDNVVSDLEVAKKMIKISQSAQDRKLDFNLKFETVKRLMSYSTCFYTGKIFGEEGSLQARSFDRVDSSKGYVEGNVVACTVDINQKKANLSIDEIICLYNKLVK